MSKLLLFFLFLFSGSLAAIGQGKTETPSTSSAAQNKVALHDAADRFIEATDARKAVEQSFAQAAEKGKEQIVKDHPQFNPAFADEWAKRFAAKFTVNDVMDAMASVYMEHFTLPELEELTRFVTARSTQKPIELSQTLKEKFVQQQLNIQSEIIGRTSQMGAKIGGEIAEEISNEHPEWIESPAAAKPK